MQYSPEQQTNYQEQLAAMQIAQAQSQMGQDQAALPISRDRDFMQWLFNFKEEVVSPLIHIWRGEEEVNSGDWRKPAKESDRLVMMNEKGITWCTSRISNFINAVYVVSNYDENSMNWTMRKEGRIVWNSISKRYEEFEIRKIDIPVIAFEIISKVHAILLGARGDGFRKFFMSTHHIDEVKSTQMNQPQQRVGSWGLFRKKQIQPMNMAEVY